MEDAVELQPDKMGRILVSSWCELRSGETPKGDQRVRITIVDRYGEKHSVKQSSPR